VPVDITAEDADIPSWIDEVKTVGLRALETRKQELDSAIGDLRTYLVLVCGTGDPLENAVRSALRRFGLEAEKTERSANIDMLAWNEDKSRRFGLEITGLNESVKKANNKLIQIMQFVQTKDDNEKAILVANTFRQTPVTQRPDESFTPPAVQFLGAHPVLMMTGYDLYRLVQDVIGGKRKPDDVVTDLYQTKGVYRYVPAPAKSRED